MAHIRIAFFLSAFLFLFSCSSEKSPIQKELAKADVIRVQFLQPGTQFVEATHIVLHNESEQLSFWRNAITDRNTEQTKCSTDGKIIFYEEDKVLLETEFKLQEGCNNVSFVYQDKLYFRELSNEALAWLKEKNVEYRK